MKVNLRIVRDGLDFRFAYRITDCIVKADIVGNNVRFERASCVNQSLKSSVLESIIGIKDRNPFPLGKGKADIASGCRAAVSREHCHLYVWNIAVTLPDGVASAHWTSVINDDYFQFYARLR